MSEAFPFFLFFCDWEYLLNFIEEEGPDLNIKSKTAQHEHLL